MSHPFYVGGTFHNHIGEYEVVSISGDDMLIRYQDGRTQDASIVFQARVWGNIQMELEDEADNKPAPSRAKSTRTARSVDTYGRNFHGLTEDDFQGSVTGTTWRARSHLGGLLAKRLSSVSGRAFESHSISRRPEVHVVQPQSFNSDIPLHEAKFAFWLTQDEALLAFYVEKNREPMDDTWDWLRLLGSFESDPHIWSGLDGIFTEFDLTWVAEIIDRSQNQVTKVQVFLEDGQLVMHNDKGSDYEFIDWQDFVRFLEGIEEHLWCDLYLQKKISKEDAIAAGVSIADQVAQVWQALMPLYLASVRSH